MELVTDLPSEPWSTPEEFARFLETHDDEPNRYELLNGRIVMTPPPAWPHYETSAKVLARLVAHVEANGPGRVGGEADILLPSGDWVRPDIMFVAEATFKAARASGTFPDRFVPDLVVETISPGTASRDRGEKRGIYQRNRVREYWIVDEPAQRITRFDLEGDAFGAPHVFFTDDTFESRLLAGLRFVVRDVFSRAP